MKQRNPDAQCENCPYFRDAGAVAMCGECRRHSNNTPGRWPGDWCGEHPEFFLPVEPVERELIKDARTRLAIAKADIMESLRRRHQAQEEGRC